MRHFIAKSPGTPKAWQGFRDSTLFRNAIIEEDDYPEFIAIAEKFGGKLPEPAEMGGPEVILPSNGFLWANEIKAHKDDILSELTDRRLNWQKMRPIQGKFREELFQLYKRKCVLTQCTVREALEAAHVLPHNGNPARDRSDNGLLLRRDLHTMFDAMLWTIDPKTKKVRLAQRLDDKSYISLKDKVINHHVDPDIPLFHYTQFNKADRNKKLPRISVGIQQIERCFAGKITFPQFRCSGFGAAE